MTLRRIVSVLSLGLGLAAGLLVLAAPLRAQSVWDRPAAAPGGLAAPPQQQQQQQQEQQACMNEFVPLRDDTEKRAVAVRAASKRHATPAEACTLFKGLVASQEKMFKYVQANATRCHIPPQIADQLKTAIGQTSTVRTRVCEVAARPQVPAGPSLSEGLGTNRIVDPSNVKTGRGTFDTLTGTPLGSAR
jgi:hypothetical protein